MARRQATQPDVVVPPAAPPARRHLRTGVAVLALLGLLVALVGVGLNLSLAGRMDRIVGAFDALADRPAAAPGETILMIGTRPGGGTDVPWLSGEQSVESVMLLEIDENGERVEVRSLPLTDGLQSAVASVSPSTAVAEVESWSGRLVDHMMAVDWRTFADLAADNGVESSYRYGSGSLAQHDYLREVLEGTLHAELRKQPLDLYRALSTTAAGTAVDDEWSLLELDLLVLRLRNLRSQEISYAMARSG